MGICIHSPQVKSTQGKLLVHDYPSVGAKISFSQENFLMTIAWSKDTGVLAKMLNTMITSNRENKSLLKVRGNQPVDGLRR